MTLTVHRAERSDVLVQKLGDLLADSERLALSTTVCCSCSIAAAQRGERPVGGRQRREIVIERLREVGGSAAFRGIDHAGYYRLEPGDVVRIPPLRQSAPKLDSAEAAEGFAWLLPSRTR